MEKQESGPTTWNNALIGARKLWNLCDAVPTFPILVSILAFRMLRFVTVDQLIGLLPSNLRIVIEAIELKPSFLRVARANLPFLDQVGRFSNSQVIRDGSAEYFQIGDLLFARGFVTASFGTFVIGANPL